MESGEAHLIPNLRTTSRPPLSIVIEVSRVGIVTIQHLPLERKVDFGGRLQIKRQLNINLLTSNQRQLLGRKQGEMNRPW
jgi:hypothetical protein